MGFEDKGAKGYGRALGQALCRVAMVTGSEEVEKAGGRLCKGEEIPSEIVGEVKSKWYGEGEVSDLPLYMRIRRAFFWTDPPNGREGRDLIVGIKREVWPEGDVEGVAIRYVVGGDSGREVAGMKIWVSRNLMVDGEATKLGRTVKGIRSYEVYPGKVWVPIPVVVLLNCLSAVRVGGDISWSLGKYPELEGILADKKRLEEYAKKADGLLPGWIASLREGFERKGWVPRRAVKK